MGKVKWGGQELADQIDSAQEGYEEYDGEPPGKGLYRFKITQIYKGESKNGFPQIELYLQLEAPSNRPNMKKYNGFFMRSWIIVKEDGSTGFKVKPFLQSLGVTPKQFATLTVIDDEPLETDYGVRFAITKMGPVKLPGAYVWGYIWPDPKNEPYYKITFKQAPNNDGDDADDNDSDSDDSGDDEAPF